MKTRLFRSSLPPEAPPVHQDACEITEPVIPAYIQLETTGVKSQNTRELLQGKFWSDRFAFKSSIAAKLREADQKELADKLDRCHTEKTIAQCNGCGRARVFFNHCDLKICPTCQPSLAHGRTEMLRWWTLQLHQPKHVVLTLRNTHKLTKETIADAKKALTKLRRSTFANNWRSGCWTLEITNEGKGWHVHFHLLIEAGWIDAKELSKRWEKATTGAGYIVKVKDARASKYLEEIAKYVAKPQQVAAWHATEIAQYVNALEGVRVFGVFGTLYGQREAWAKFKLERELTGSLCACGCKKWTYYDENHWNWLHTCSPMGPAPKPRDPENQREFAVMDNVRNLAAVKR